MNGAGDVIISRKAGRALVALCVLALLVSSLPLYIISFYNHPYYDDFSFSADTHQAWQSTQSLSATFRQAIESAKSVRRNWQGTYTGTLLSNLQPSVFSEKLYFIGTFIILSAFILCFSFFIYTLLARGFGVDRRASACLSCLLPALMIQLMPNVGEAFFWFNGGIGNTFIYSLMALALTLTYRLLTVKSLAGEILLTIALSALMVLLGGGSYGGGLFGLCLYALIALYLLIKRNKRGWHVLALWALFLACFLYSVSAPGNTVRSYYIPDSLSPLQAVGTALYNGMAQIGGYIRLPIIALTLLFMPAIYAAAKKSARGFRHPCLATLLIYLLYCTQLVPPLYAGVGIGAGRIVNTYYISFTALWLVWVYYVVGYASRLLTDVPSLSRKSARGLALACAALMLVGCLGFKRDSDELPGLQNLSGASAAISMLNGEARTFHSEMLEREHLLNDSSQKAIVLSPLSASPSVFMEDLLTPETAESVIPSLCLYYGKASITLEGGGDAR